MSVGKLPKPAARTPASANVADAGTHAASSGRDSAPPPSDAAASSAAPRLGPQIDSADYAVSIEAGPRSEFCQHTGSALTSSRMSGTLGDCEARVERRVFAYGLCACEELQTDRDTFLIDSFDSSQGRYSPGQTGGNVGVNSASLQWAETTQILGSLWLAGDGALTLAAPSFLVSGDLKTNSTLHVTADNQRIARDLWTSADIVVDRGSLRVDRDAYQAPGHTGLDQLKLAGQRYPATEYRVAPPCSCDANAAIDVAAVVLAARDHNDNAAVSFDAKLVDIDSYVTDLKTLPCGRLYAASLNLRGPSTYGLSSESRSALFIQGDLKVATLSTLYLNNSNPSGPTGELDLFIAGDIVVEPNATLSLGDPARPAQTRVFLAGQIKAQGAIELAANLYAPNATFACAAPIAGATDLYGSIHAHAIHFPTKRFHYDRAILDMGESCSAPAPQRCGACNACPDDLACTSGTCQACQSDADCCEPRACNAGKCQLLVSNWP